MINEKVPFVKSDIELNKQRIKTIDAEIIELVRKRMKYREKIKDLRRMIK